MPFDKLIRKDMKQMKPIQPTKEAWNQIEQAAQIIEAGFDPSDYDLELIEEMIEDGFEDDLPESVMEYMDDMESMDEGED